jgi:hypothetical protein
MVTPYGAIFLHDDTWSVAHTIPLVEKKNMLSTAQYTFVIILGVWHIQGVLRMASGMALGGLN